ncbi:unnamed protein product [Dicrocoelium dendriticum]|nr:unnamed protein product [Dicrocoelium dendriticum]
MSTKNEQYSVVFQVEEDPQWTRYLSIMSIKAFGDEIALSYYAFGFLIYYATGQAFRHRVHYLLRRLLNSCGFHCKPIMRLGVSDDFEFVPNKRRAVRGQTAGTELRCTAVPIENSPPQVTNAVQPRSQLGCLNNSEPMSSLASWQDTQAGCVEVLAKKHNQNHTSQALHPSAAEKRHNV